MAKLTNVKTVDMVNGEITKVAYDGAEYAKVVNADTGDLLLANESSVDIDYGAFYKCESALGGQVGFRDNERFLRHRNEDAYIAFRKISAPTLEERVTELESDVASLKGEKANETIEFEGATYRKVDREAREGDVVISNAKSTCFVTKGKPYKVTDDGCGTTLNAGTSDVINLYNGGRNTGNVDVYEPIEQAKYIPQEGDVVVIIANNSGSRNAVGDIGKLSEVTSYDAKVNVPAKPDSDEVDGNWHVFDDFRKASPAEVEAYEKAAHKASFAIGDYVKLIKSERGNEGAIAKIIEVGEIGTKHVDGSITVEPFRLEHLTGKIAGETTAGPAEWVVKATDTEIEKATAPKLKAGDFVKITSGTPSIIEGEIYEVLRDDENELHIIDKDGDSRWFPLALGRAKYEIVDAETAKWAKLGRKVNEVKVGDLVEITDKCGAANVGEIVKVKRAVEQGDGGTRIYYDHHKRNDYTAHEGSYKLVAPVESTVA